MLAEPYPLESEFRVRLLKIRPTGIQVGATQSGKVNLVFDDVAETISMSKQAAAKLGEEVTKMCDSLVGSNAS